MTNKEALIAVIDVDIANNTIEKALLDNDISGTDTYTKSNEKKIDTAAISVLQVLLNKPNVSEGGFSQSFDRKAVQDRISFLCGKHGLPNPVQPKVRSRAIW